MNPCKCIKVCLSPEPPRDPPLITYEQLEKARKHQAAGPARPPRPLVTRERREWMPDGYQVPHRPMVGNLSKFPPEPFEGRPDIEIKGQTWRWIGERTLLNLTPPKRTCNYLLPDDEP